MTAAQEASAGDAQSSASAAVRSLAVAARTVLAATHEAQLVVPGSVPVSLVVLDEGGQPLLAAPRGVELPAASSAMSGLVRVSVAALDSHLHLVGRLHPGDPVAVESLTLLHAHRDCLAEALGCGVPTLYTLVPEHVGYRAPRAATVPVSLAAYADAEPDLFAAYGDAIATHLREQHGEQLRQLARARIGAAEILALDVREVSQCGITVDVVTVDGGWTLPLLVGTPAQDPHAVCASLHALTRSPQSH